VAAAVVFVTFYVRCVYVLCLPCRWLHHRLSSGKGVRQITVVHLITGETIQMNIVPKTAGDLKKELAKLRQVPASSLRVIVGGLELKNRAPLPNNGVRIDVVPNLRAAGVSGSSKQHLCPNCGTRGVRSTMSRHLEKGCPESTKSPNEEEEETHESENEDENKEEREAVDKGRRSQWMRTKTMTWRWRWSPQ